MWGSELSPEELIVIKGHITDFELDALCEGLDRKSVRKWAGKRFKKIGARYERGHAGLYGSWQFGLPDLHHHPVGTKLGGLGQSPEEFYRGLLGEASDELVSQSLLHENALLMRGEPNWASVITDEMARRGKEKGEST